MYYTNEEKIKDMQEIIELNQKIIEVQAKRIENLLKMDIISSNEPIILNCKGD